MPIGAEDAGDGIVMVQATLQLRHGARVMLADDDRRDRRGDPGGHKCAGFRLQAQDGLAVASADQGDIGFWPAQAMERERDEGFTVALHGGRDEMIEIHDDNPARRRSGGV